jgi:hypothetical protein
MCVCVCVMSHLQMGSQETSLLIFIVGKLTIDGGNPLLFTQFFHLVGASCHYTTLHYTTVVYDMSSCVMVLAWWSLQCVWPLFVMFYVTCVLCCATARNDVVFDVCWSRWRLDPDSTTCTMRSSA